MTVRTGALRHTHRYLRTFPNVNRNEAIWRCTLDGCTHFVPYNTTVIGRKSLCWECGAQFFMEEKHLEQEMPVCFDCSGGVAAKALEDLIEQQLARARKTKFAGPVEPDVVEKEEVHTAECIYASTGYCTCGAK